MQGTLTVDVNPDGMHTLTVPERFGADEAFDVVLENHGEPTHVYLNLDDSLSEVATLDATNYYVEQDETLRITISLSPTATNEEVSGDLTVATAYGSEKRFVPITIEPSEQKRSADTRTAGTTQTQTTQNASSNASQSRSRSRSRSAASYRYPSPRTPTSASLDERIIRRTLPAVVFGVVAIILAFSSLLITGTPRIVLGVLAILAGLIVIVYLIIV